jgi:hypothetical protein
MDKKFLEGFVEITAAAGISPRHAHAALIKKANKQRLISAGGRAVDWARNIFKRTPKNALPTTPPLKSPPRSPFTRVAQLPTRTKVIGAGAGLGAIGYAGYKGLQALNDMTSEYKQPPTTSTPAPYVAGAPSYTHWGTPENAAPKADPFNPASTAARTSVDSGKLPVDARQYASDQRALRSARSQQKKIDEMLGTAQVAADEELNRINNPTTFDAIADATDEIPLIGYFSKKWLEAPANRLDEQSKIIAEQKAKKEEIARQIADTEKRISENKR